ncbi:MAG: aconitate hydratase [Candidatus Melainabacteria bacterium]|nr:aconitate hydratase [Candidatus Melainabacteria bacterium]
MERSEYLACVALVKTLYEALPERLNRVRQLLGRPALTTTEKILYAHLDAALFPSDGILRGTSMLSLRPDRVAMQDATAQMAILQFMQAQRDTVAVPSTVHCDHLIRAQSGATEDMTRAIDENREVYEFLRSAAARYGMGFWKPGSGIIHQVVLEKYAFPGGLMIGTDSHTPNAGGLGMLAIGVGGADAADTMAGLPWEVRAPKLIGVHLTGRLSGWTAPKDVILKLLGLLTTKGGTNHIVEYFGPGAESLSCTGKGTITNMGAELGATTSVFAFDARMAAYLRATERAEIAELAEQYQEHLVADAAVYENPSAYYDQVIEIDLSTLEPMIVGPHAPDKARPLSQFAQEVEQAHYPKTFSAALIGSCTNSSYEDMERAASLARQAVARGIEPQVPLLITPGSDQIYQTIQQNGQLALFNQLGATVLANACGPCIGNWDRQDIRSGEVNAIITSFNRNFPKRNDGNAETLSFIASPDLVMAFALAGRTTFNPLTDTLADGQPLLPPQAPDLPPSGFSISWEGYLPSLSEGRETLTVAVAPDSQRLEILQPFQPWSGQDFEQLPILIKTQGQTTTDHISPAGKDWLPLRGHLSGISHNLLLGAVDAETGSPAAPVKMQVNGVERGVSPWALKAKEYQATDGGSVIVGDENYGEGSSREHAAMSPRLLGVRAVIVRSFARIHETNLKKQGILPLTFQNTADYNELTRHDRLSLIHLKNLAAGQPVEATVHKPDGSTKTLWLNHSLTTEQIRWFQAGSAMNAVNRPELLSQKR